MAYPQRDFAKTTFPSSGYISGRREVVYSNTLLYQLNVLKSTGRYDAFQLKWHPSYNDKPDVWPVPNHLFWDSDVAKWIEGACYFLQWQQNAEIDAAVKELVEMIRSAQQPDGYLNIHFTVVEPEKRFTCLRDLHELYNAGHLIEAALAHNHHYGNDRLMEPILKYVDLLCEVFGPGQTQKHGYPGHPEIELALLRLYNQTGKSKHFNLAKFFLEERGNPTGQNGRHYYDAEFEARGGLENERPVYLPSNRSYWYSQAHKPIVEQETIEGHSVRAMYLLTAVADLARIEELPQEDVNRIALKRLWDNMVNKKMYLTGGIGAIKQWEGFGVDYFLPSGTDEGGCYAETCAAIGVMMLAERLLQLELDGKLADIMELCFYNAVMTAMSANGKQFTYINQLASSDTDLSKRAEWFTCACCPPNITRLLGYIGGYIWSSRAPDTKSVEVDVHMYSSATLSFPLEGGCVFELEQKTNWPWEGTIGFKITNPSSVSATIRLRIPAWAEVWEMIPSVEGAKLNKGYLTLSPEWLRSNPSFELRIHLKPRFVSPHPYTNQDIVALARGPIIYCVEDVDNPWVEDHFNSLLLDPTTTITATNMREVDTGGSYVALSALDNFAFMDVDTALAPAVSRTSIQRAVAKINFIPYCIRDNRGGKGHMRVGIRRRR